MWLPAKSSAAMVAVNKLDCLEYGSPRSFFRASSDSTARHSSSSPLHAARKKALRSSGARSDTASQSSSILRKRSGVIEQPSENNRSRAAPIESRLNELE